MRDPNHWVLESVSSNLFSQGSLQGQLDWKCPIQWSVLFLQWGCWGGGNRIWSRIIILCELKCCFLLAMLTSSRILQWAQLCFQWRCECTSLCSPQLGHQWLTRIHWSLASEPMSWVGLFVQACRWEGTYGSMDHLLASKPLKKGLPERSDCHLHYPLSSGHAFRDSQPPASARKCSRNQSCIY